MEKNIQDLIGTKFECRLMKTKNYKEISMKKVLILAILVLSQNLMAQVKEVKSMSRFEAKQKIESNETYKKISEKVSKGQKLDANEIRFLEKAVSMYTTNTGVSVSSLYKLVAMKPELLADVVKLSSIIQAKTSKSEDVTKAKTDLQILEKGSLAIDANSATAKDDIDTLSKVSELPDYNTEAKNFRTNLVQELSSGKSLDEAIKAASNGKISREKLKDCAI